VLNFKHEDIGHTLYYTATVVRTSGKWTIFLNIYITGYMLANYNEIKVQSLEIYLLPVSQALEIQETLGALL